MIRDSAGATITEQLTAFCAGLRLDGTPPAVIDKAKELLLDYLGVAYRGMQVESSQAALRAVRALSGAGQATVVGEEGGAPAAWAALANGTGAHALEMDDVTSKSSLHPGVAVFPAVLALAEELGSTAEEVLVAAIAGYEVMMRVGNALNPASAYRRGFHPTGVAGAFGATMAAGRLLGLGERESVSALGIAGTTAAGSLEYLTDGAWTKRLNAGWAAHCGIVAARLAAEGFTGPASSIEGPLGLLRGHSDEPWLAEATAHLGESFELLDVSIKPYACCRYNHGLIDCVLRLAREHRLRPDDVEAIELGVLSGGFPLVADPIERKRNPVNVVDAQFSAPFAAAIALVRGSAGLRDYTQANVDDPVVRSVMAKVRCYTDPALDDSYPEQWPAAVSIRLVNGQRLDARESHPLGEPENPVSRAALVQKFREMIDRPFADEVIDRVEALPNGSIGDLMGLFRA